MHRLSPILLYQIKENMMKDITLAIGLIGVLSLVAMGLAEKAEIITVLSYTVTAIGSLATGHALK